MTDARNNSTRTPVARKDFAETPISDRERTKSGKAMCQECPFRETNRGRENPFNHYKNDSLTAYWRAISQDGGFFACHMFAVDAYAHDDRSRALGFKDPANIGTARECAGTVGVLRRELDILDTYESWEQYKKDRPTGISEKTVAQLRARLAGTVEPPLTFSDFVKPEDVIHPEDWIDPTDVHWVFSMDAAVNLLLAMSVIAPEVNECECPTCANHASVHPSAELTTASGHKVLVDKALQPLLASLAAAGVETTASCLNLHEALTALSPGELGPLTNMSKGSVNYRNVLLRKGAFIRLSNATAAARAFLLAASQDKAIEIASHGKVTQIVFPDASLPHLAALANVVATVAQRTDHNEKDN